MWKQALKRHGKYIDSHNEGKRKKVMGIERVRE